MSSLKNINHLRKIVYIYLIFFLLLLLYTFYRSEIVYDGNQISYYYKYYLIFTFSSIFWLAVLFCKERLKLIVIVIATSLLLLLYFFEVIRFYSPSILKLFSEKIEQVDQSKYELIKRLKEKEDAEVVPSIFPKAILDINRSITIKKNKILPLGGVSNAITVFCKEGENYSVYKSDRHGFNNPDYEWDSEKVDWLLIGDSFTHGSCVNQGEDFAGQIRQLTKKSAINLGMSGNGPLLELASLMEFGQKIKPSAVLWFYFERNDFNDLRAEKSNNVLMKYLKNEKFNQNLNLKQNEADKLLREYIKLAEKNLISKKKEKEENNKFLSLKKIIRLQIVREKLSLDRGLDFGIDPLFKKIIKKADTIIKEIGGQLYFVYLPDKERYTSKTINHDSYLKRSKVINLIYEMNIPIIDIHKDFLAKHNDPLSFYAHRIYGHYSPGGYAAISKVIVDKVNSLKK